LAVPTAPTASWRALAGVLVAAALAVWLGAVGVQVLSASGDLSWTLEHAPGEMVAPALVGVVVAIWLAERRWPAEPRPWNSRAHLVDAGYFALFAAIVAPLLVLVEIGFSAEIGQHARFLELSRVPIAPRVAVIITILAAMDAMNWAGHVANHRFSSLWRLHALHHSQEEMSVFTTFRTHPLIHVSYLASLLPALVLGAGGTVPAWALIVYSSLITLPHGNLTWDFGRIGRVVVSPAYHRLHHALDPVDGQMAVNFGFVLTCWDRLAHVDAWPQGRGVVATGLADRSVPVEQTVGRSDLPSTLWSQIAQPFTVCAATTRKTTTRKTTTKGPQSSIGRMPSLGNALISTRVVVSGKGKSPA